MAFYVQSANVGSHRACNHIENSPAAYATSATGRWNVNNVLWSYDRYRSQFESKNSTKMHAIFVDFLHSPNFDVTVPALFSAFLGHCWILSHIPDNLACLTKTDVELEKSYILAHKNLSPYPCGNNYYLFITWGDSWKRVHVAPKFLMRLWSVEEEPQASKFIDFCFQHPGKSPRKQRKWSCQTLWCAPTFTWPCILHVSTITSQLFWHTFSIFVQ